MHVASRTLGVLAALLSSSTAAAFALIDAGTVPLGDVISSNEVVAGDFNGDGRQDLLFCHADRKLIVKLQAADGALVQSQELPVWNAHAPVPPNTSYSILSLCHRMQVSDLNRDGKSDVVITHRVGFTTLIATAEGFARTEVAFADPAESNRVEASALLDVDQDGDQDLVAASISGRIRLWKNRAPGAWDGEVTIAQALGSGTISLRAGDLDADGLVDFVLASDTQTSPSTSRLELFKNRGNGNFANGQLIQMPERSVAGNFEIGDVNDDGRDDLVYVSGTGGLSVLPQLPAGGFGANREFEVFTNPYTLVLDDMDNDGLTDVVMSHTGWFAVTSHRQTADGLDEQSFTSPIPNIQSRRQGMASGDFNGDGCKDIVLAVQQGYHLLSGVDCNRAVSVNPTGVWFDPAQDGHGLQLQMLDDNRLLAFWYSFDLVGNPAYWFGEGRFDGATVVMYNYRPTGSFFPPDFVPAGLTFALFGSMRISFESCSRAAVHFDLPSGFGRGSMNLTRLTQPQGVDCDGVSSVPAGDPMAGATGAWHDTARDGQGFLFESLPGGRLLAIWYSQAPRPTGGQTWLTGLGSITGSSATIEMSTFQGGRFIPNFDPAQVVRQRRGTITVRMDSCTAGQVNWNLGPSYGSGSMPLRRLTLPAGVACSGP